MSIAIPIEMAKQNLEDLLKQLPLGETLTLISAGGAPIAIVVSIQPGPSAPSKVKIDPQEWKVRWETLAEKVSEAWQGDKSGLEILAEMRR